ncbi:hypothetical protein [Desemzia sp. FAM 23989]|uniref:hypothetical protein n=1 Tax=Desemzia sp. FAM 23989 TaxID=3259523 RepID=UPI00388A4EB0
MKKIKKYFPLIIGLLLLLSVAAYGTRAYFSDSTSQEAGIELTLGDVDVEGTPGTWKYNQFNTEEHNDKIVIVGAETEPDFADLGTEVTIKNARPGDSFSKVFTFKNTGTLDQKLAFTTTNNNKDSIFDVTWNGTSDEVVKPGNSVQVEMIVTVSIDGNHQHGVTDSANTSDLKSTLNKLVSETVEVNAVQTNALE